MTGQLSFWGYNEDGRFAKHGERLIYFVASGDYVKIGTTTRNVEDRIGELECGNPADMNLIGTIVVRDGSDDRRLHERFAVFHHRGEWFRKTPELIKAINDLLYSAEQPQNVRHWPVPLVVDIPEKEWIHPDGIERWYFCPSCFGQDRLKSVSGFGVFRVAPVSVTQIRCDFSFTCTACHTKVAVQLMRSL